jgi:hypothetical protein
MDENDKMKDNSMDECDHYGYLIPLVEEIKYVQIK